MDRKGVGSAGPASGALWLQDAHAAPPIKPDEDAVVVRPGHSLSFKSLLKSLLCLAALAGRGAGAAQVSLPEVIGGAFDEGVRKVGVLLDPGDVGIPGECDLIAHAIKGAGTNDGEPGGRPVTMFIWSPRDVPEAESGAMYFQRMERSMPLDTMCGGLEHAGALIEALTQQPGVKVMPTNFLDKSSPAVQSLLGPSDQASVGVLSMMLALGADNDPAIGSSVKFPWHDMNLGGPKKFWPEYARPSYETFLHMQKAAPTMALIDGRLWLTNAQNRFFNRDEILTYYQGQGYLIGELQSGSGAPQGGNVSLILPPLPGVLDRLDAYAKASGQKLTLARPDKGAINRYQRRYPQHFQPLQPNPDMNIFGGIAGLVLATGVVCCLYRVKGGNQARVRSVRAPVARQRRPAPGTGGNDAGHAISKRKVKIKSVDQDSKGQSEDKDLTKPQPPLPRPRTGSELTNPRGVYKEALQALQEFRTQGDRIKFIQEWRPDVVRALGSGHPELASAFMRAIIDADPRPERLGRLLKVLGVNFKEVIESLQDLARNPENTNAINEHHLLAQHQRLVNLALARQPDYAGNEKGRQGPPSRPTLVPGSRASPSSDVAAKDEASPNYCTLDKVWALARQHVRKGIAYDSGGDIFIGTRPQAMPHLHLGKGFLSLKRHDGVHIRVFVNGGLLREDSLAKAVAYAKSPEGQRSPEIGKVLDFIRGEGPYATTTADGKATGNP